MNPVSDYKVNKNTLELAPPGRGITFKWPISEVIPFRGVLVVRVDPEPGACFNENVYGIGLDGTVVWQIEARKHVYDDSPYTKILASEDGVILFNWDGDEILADPLDGQVLQITYGK